MSNADHTRDIEQSVDVAAEAALVEAAPSVQAACVARASAEQAQQAWAPSLAHCVAVHERAIAATRDLRAQREPVLLPARLDTEPAAVEQLARLTAALTAAVLEEEDAARTLALAQGKADALDAQLAAADRRVLEARYTVSEALDAEAAVEGDERLATAALFLSRWFVRKTQTARAAQTLGIPVAAAGRHPRAHIRASRGVLFPGLRALGADGVTGAAGGGHAARDALHGRLRQRAATPGGRASARPRGT